MAQCAPQILPCSHTVCIRCVTKDASGGKVPLPDRLPVFIANSSTYDVYRQISGVFGFLTLWGVGIDPFSMASLLMSIGFSVDICAHISYHYYESKEPVRFLNYKNVF